MCIRSFKWQLSSPLYCPISLPYCVAKVHKKYTQHTWEYQDNHRNKNTWEIFPTFRFTLHVAFVMKNMMFYISCFILKVALSGLTIKPLSLMLNFLHSFRSQGPLKRELFAYDRTWRQQCCKRLPKIIPSLWNIVWPVSLLLLQHRDESR